MSKSRSQPDVLILGSHPCCSLAGALLHEQKTSALIASIPGKPIPDRLVLLNPKLFEIHKLTAALKKLTGLVPVNGLRFLADDSATWSEYIAKTTVGCIGEFSKIQNAMLDQAKRAKVEMIESKTLEIHGADENGVDVSINGAHVRPKMLMVGGELPAPARRVLGLPEHWDVDVMHRYTFLRIKGSKAIDPSVAKLIPMSLDLGGMLRWGWVFCGADSMQIAVEQPSDTVQKNPPLQLLGKWIDVLLKHRVLKAATKPFDTSEAESIDLPLAGALAQEGVANRTLLIGPAGGFYNACAEDIYPCCWSSIFAVAVATKALAAKHLQDALGAYRETWGSTLGDYLRGPQENLRFLLPLVYRNSVMTARMGEAILSGESVVR